MTTLPRSASQKLKSKRRLKSAMPIVKELSLRHSSADDGASSLAQFEHRRNVAIGRSPTDTGFISSRNSLLSADESIDSVPSYHGLARKKSDSVSKKSKEEKKNKRNKQESASAQEKTSRDKVSFSIKAKSCVAGPPNKLLQNTREPSYAWTSFMVADSSDSEGDATLTNLYMLDRLDEVEIDTRNDWRPYKAMADDFQGKDKADGVLLLTRKGASLSDWGFLGRKWGISESFKSLEKRNSVFAPEPKLNIDEEYGHLCGLMRCLLKICPCLITVMGDQLKAPTEAETQSPRVKVDGYCQTVNADEGTRLLEVKKRRNTAHYDAVDKYGRNK